MSPEEENTIKANMVRIEFYVPPSLEETAESLARQDGITKSELYRQSLYQGLSYYAERSNKLKINKRLNQKTEE